jgi:hypothetical protein
MARPTRASEKASRHTETGARETPSNIPHT